jgi:hypothetical protein
MIRVSARGVAPHWLSWSQNFACAMMSFNNNVNTQHTFVCPKIINLVDNGYLKHIVTERICIVEISINVINQRRKNVQPNPVFPFLPGCIPPEVDEISISNMNLTSLSGFMMNRDTSNLFSCIRMSLLLNTGRTEGQKSYRHTLYYDIWGICRPWWSGGWADA